MPAARSTRLLARLTALAPHLALLAALVLLWEAAVRMGWVNTFLVPSPSRIARAFWTLYVAQGTIWWHFFVTMLEAVLGFLIGASIGIGLAVASALNEPFRRYVSPYAVVLNVTPGLALTPIIITWFGFGWGSKIALAAVITFFPIFVNTLAGLARREADREELFLSLGADPVQRFWKLQVPGALPLMFAGLKIGMTTALIGAVVAEFAQATEGVGVLMQRYSFKLDMASAVAVLLTMSLMGLTLFTIMEILDDRLVFWRRDAGMERVSRRRRAAFRAAAAVPGGDARTLSTTTTS
jgi:NitT/TauT family transport system permease protein